MVYHLRCNSPSDNSKKILQKIESIQRATFEDILGVLKTRVGIGRSADQIQIAYVGSVFHSSVLVEKATGHNHLKTQSFVNAIQELGEIATTDPTQRNIQEELDNSAFDNLLGKQKSIKQKAPFQSLSAAVWCLVIFSPNPALRLHLSSIKLRVALKYRLGVKLYENSRKSLVFKFRTLDVMGDHAVSFHGRGDMISRHDGVRQIYMSYLGSSFVCHL